MRSEYRAIAAIILALGVALSAILIVVETILHTGPVVESEATVLSTVLGASVGAVATYLGGAMADSHHNPTTPAVVKPEPPGEQ